MATKNHNFRFNTEKEEEQRAWDLLHSREVEQGFKSQNEFVIMAINDYYDRHLETSNDPYLETREKEEAFADRIVQMVQEKMFVNMPALAGMYLMSQQQNFSVPVMNGIDSMMGRAAPVTVGTGANIIPQAKTTEVLEKVTLPHEEPLTAEELPDNDFLDTDAW
jgi:hypothetical protein